ncbi:MAG: CBS domain-containing protein [Desulfobulbaceae bacterium]|nr:CBS domain-containing protein [Desulfobulbaceae bacterium]
MDVSKCMKTRLLLATPDTDYKSLLCKMAEPVPRQIYVVEQNYKLLGIISAFDLLKEILPSYMTSDLAKSITDGTDFMQKQVEKVTDKFAKDLMVTDFIYLHPHSQLLQADALIVEKGCNALPVIDERGKLLGEITRFDILASFVTCYISSGDAETDLVDLSKV